MEALHHTLAIQWAEKYFRQVSLSTSYVKHVLILLNKLLILKLLFDKEEDQKIFFCFILLCQAFSKLYGIYLK